VWLQQQLAGATAAERGYMFVVVDDCAIVIQGVRLECSHECDLPNYNDAGTEGLYVLDLLLWSGVVCEKINVVVEVVLRKRGVVSGNLFYCRLACSAGFGDDSTLT
jgi:hypothetical protein